jgi:hypothetical protein
VGPDQLRVRAVHRRPTGQQRGGAGPVLARLHDVDRQGGRALHRPLPAGQVRGPGHRPRRPDRADLRIHRRGARTRHRAALLRPRASAVRPGRLQDLEHQPGQRRLGRPGLDDAGREDTRTAAGPGQRAGRCARLHPGRRALGDRGQTGRPAGTEGRPAAGGGRGPGGGGNRWARPGVRDAAGLGQGRRWAGQGGAVTRRRGVRPSPRGPRERVGPALRVRPRVGRRRRLVAA